MATRDRPTDVTTEPVDVSSRVMDMAWCYDTRESRQNTTSAVLCTQEAENSAQCITTIPLIFYTSQIKRGCLARTRERADEVQDEDR